MAGNSHRWTIPLTAELKGRLDSSHDGIDHVIDRGLEILNASATPNHSQAVDVVTMRARCAVLLAEAVRLRDRLREIEGWKRSERERRVVLEARFRELQREAAAIDPSLLDLRPEESRSE